MRIRGEHILSHSLPLPFILSSLCPLLPLLPPPHLFFFPWVRTEEKPSVPAGQGKHPYQKWTLLEMWSWISKLPALWEIRFLCISLAICGTCDGILSRPSLNHGKLVILQGGCNLRPSTALDKRNGITFFLFRVVCCKTLTDAIITSRHLLPIINFRAFVKVRICVFDPTLCLHCWCDHPPPSFCFFCELHWLICSVRTIWQHQNSRDVLHTMQCTNIIVLILLISLTHC